MCKIWCGLIVLEPPCFMRNLEIYIFPPKIKP